MKYEALVGLIVQNVIVLNCTISSGAGDRMAGVCIRVCLRVEHAGM